MRHQQTCRQCAMCTNVVKKSNILWLIHKDVLHLFPICKSCNMRVRLDIETEPVFVTVVLEYMENRGTVSLDAFAINDLRHARPFIKQIATIRDIRRMGIYLARSEDMVVERSCVSWFPSKELFVQSFQNACPFVYSS